jgi:hypothetical protein
MFLYADILCVLKKNSQQTILQVQPTWNCESKALVCNKGQG